MLFLFEARRSLLKQSRVGKETMVGRETGKGSMVVAISAPLVLVLVYLALGPDAPSDAALIAAGAKVDAAVADGAWWRLVSAGALHASLLHVMLNSVLWGFGIAAWTRLGRTLGDEGVGRALAAVALAVVASTAGFLASFIARAGPSVGASGAALGVLAAVVVAVWRRRGDLPTGLRTRGPIALGAAYVAVLVASSWAPGVDHFAHLGGAFAGFLLAPLADRSGRSRLVLGVMAASLIAVAVAIALTDGRPHGI